MTLDLARLEALEKAATPGPWKWVGSKKADEAYLVGSQFRTGLGQCAFDDPAVVMNVDPSYGEYSRSIDINGADAALIVEAVNALPELIAAAYGLEQAKREAAQWKTAYFGEKGSERHANVTERDDLRARLAEAEQLLGLFLKRRHEHGCTRFKMANELRNRTPETAGCSCTHKIVSAFLARSRETESVPR